MSLYRQRPSTLRVEDIESRAAKDMPDNNAPRFSTAEVRLLIRVFQRKYDLAWEHGFDSGWDAHAKEDQ